MINLVLSPDKLNKYSICPTLYDYETNGRYAPLFAGKETYLDEGSIMHKGLQIYYTAKMEGRPIDVTTIQELMRNHAAESGDLPVEKLEEVCADFAMYCQYYSNKESWVIEAVEEPFAKDLCILEIGGEQYRVILNGKIDLRVRTMNGKGPRAIIDHKYEGRFNDKADRDNQALCYAWAYESKDFIFNRIGKQKTYTPEKRLLRPYFSYAPHQIKEWEEETINTARRIIEDDISKKYAKLYTGCTSFGKKCRFYEVCNTTPDNREYKLDTLFSVRASSGKSVMDHE